MPECRNIDMNPYKGSDAEGIIVSKSENKGEM